MASLAPSAFCGWAVASARLFAGSFPSLLPSAFPFLPLGSFSPFFAGAFLGLGSGFGGAGFADNRADLLCGSRFTFTLSPLASPLAFLLGMVAAGLSRWLCQSRVFFCLPHTAPRKILTRICHLDSRVPRGPWLLSGVQVSGPPPRRSGRRAWDAEQPRAGVRRQEGREPRMRFRGSGRRAAGPGAAAPLAFVGRSPRPPDTTPASAPRPGASETRKGGERVYESVEI